MNLFPIRSGARERASEQMSAAERASVDFSHTTQHALRLWQKIDKKMIKMLAAAPTLSFDISMH